MPRCYTDCKYHYDGFCKKYNKTILKSKNILHYGLALHPFEDLTLYYKKNRTIDKCLLVKFADEYLTDDISKDICRQYKQIGYISYKQVKMLLHKFFNCYEDKNFDNLN